LSSSSTSSDFPLGWLPLDLLRALSRSLCATLAFGQAHDLPPHHMTAEDSHPAWDTSPALLLNLGWLSDLPRRDLEDLALIEVERLLRLMRTAMGTLEHIQRDALLSTLYRLGQVYAVCKTRWGAKEARALVQAQANRLWESAQQVYELLTLAGPIMAKHQQKRATT
jgi:hypothetical protein